MRDKEPRISPAVVLDALTRVTARLVGGSGHLGSLVPDRRSLQLTSQERNVDGVTRIGFSCRFSRISEFDIAEDDPTDSNSEAERVGPDTGLDPCAEQIDGWIEINDDQTIAYDSNGKYRVAPWETYRNDTDTKRETPVQRGADATRDSEQRSQHLSSDEIDELLDNL